MQKTEKPDYSDQLCPICKVNPARTGTEYEFDKDYNHNDPKYDDDDYYYDTDPKVKKIYFVDRCKSCEDKREARRLEHMDRARIKKIPEIITRYGVNKQHRNAALSDISVELREKVGNKKSLFIHGKCGTGKTYLAAAIVREELAKDRRADVYLIDIDDLLSEIKSTFGTNVSNAEETEQELVERYATVETLCLDDIGAEKVTDWSASVLRRIINKRDGGEMRTIFTSNYSLDELTERLGDRITSRISGMCEAICLAGSDRRLNK